jgi:hypothetical protein
MKKPGHIKPWKSPTPKKSAEQELVEALREIVEIAEQQTFNDVMDNPCGAYDMFTEVDSIASEALSKYEGKV